MRKFVCSKEGFRRSKDKSVCDEEVRTSRHETRCGCMASFKIRLQHSDSLYYPVELNAEHNHELALTEYSHFLRSHRNIDDASAQLITELRGAGIKPSQIFNVFVNSRGGYERVGFTRVDLYNHLYNTATTLASTNEFDAALKYISGLASVDPGVYCRTHTNEHDHITRLFFSDSISRTEYTIFGDVICCDATYKTNHLLLPVVLLSGVDNHTKCTMFACILITDEEKETYKWIYETFLACMGKAPGVIITDGDRAMRWAIRETMPHTRHRLCSWHIMRNLQGVCQNHGFKRDLQKLFNKRYTIDEFNNRWATMLETYRLNKRNKRWVADMSSTVTMWGESYFVGVFCAGMRSNQRSESTNSTLKGFVDTSLTIGQFFHKYFNFLDHLRQVAMQKECQNSQSMPANLDREPFQSIRSQIANLYTLSIYKKVDRQMSLSESYTCDMRNSTSNATHDYLHVVRCEVDEEQSKPCIVAVDRRDWSLNCMCGMIESDGLTCKHAFAAIKQLKLVTIAQSNLTPRWMKNARQLCNLSSTSSQIVRGCSHRLVQIRPMCERLAHLASLGQERMDIAMQEIEKLANRICEIDVNHDEVEINLLHPNNMEVPPVFRDPPVVRTKGAPSVRKAKTPRKCTYCHQPGHSRPTCEQKKEDEGDEGAMHKKTRKSVDDG